MWFLTTREGFDCVTVRVATYFIGIEWKNIGNSRDNRESSSAEAMPHVDSISSSNVQLLFFRNKPCTITPISDVDLMCNS